MYRDWFKIMLRFIRFDCENTQCAQTDKIATLRDIFTLFIGILEKAYKPYECIIIDKHLFPFRFHAKLIEHIPSEPAKYGIKFFQGCDSSNA